MSCGVVFLAGEDRRTMNSGYRTNDDVASDASTPVLTFTQEGLYSAYGPGSSATSDGICGAPSVEEDTSRGKKDGYGVCGFIRMISAAVAACPCLDKIIDRSWEVY